MKGQEDRPGVLRAGSENVSAEIGGTVMETHQFALYQLKNIPENRTIRYRSFACHSLSVSDVLVLNSSGEITEEQNYNMIDGCMNNLPIKPRKIGKCISVLDWLHLKQAEIARRSFPCL